MNTQLVSSFVSPDHREEEQVQAGHETHGYVRVMCIYRCQYRHHFLWGSVRPKSHHTCAHRLGVTCVWGQGTTVASQAWLGIPAEEFGKLETTMLLLLFFREIFQTAAKSSFCLSKLRAVNSKILHPWRF